MLAAARVASAVAVRRAPAVGLRPVAAASFHTGRPVFDDAGAAIKVDKENPQYLPDDFNEWENVGYKNLAPRGTLAWDDLPEKYRYFWMKVDPADVENEPVVWKVLTDWRLALPVGGIATVPLFLYDVVSVDMRLMLAAITVTTFSILKVNVGPMLADTFGAGMKEVRDALYKTEADYRASIADLTEAHTQVMGLEADLRARNEAERELKALEAKAATRSVRAAQVAHMQSMLDAMVQMQAMGDADAGKAIDAAAIAAVEGKLASDAKLQQASIEDAIAAVEDRASSNLYASTVAKEYIASLQAEIAKADEGGDDAARAAHQREIFNKKFGFASPTITAAQAKAASEDPKVNAQLTAWCGGAKPVEGAKIVFRSPTSY